MSTLPARLEDILDRCISAMQERGMSVEDCLAETPANSPPDRASLEPLLRVAARFQAGETVSASAEFRQSSALRMQNLISAHPRTGGVSLSNTPRPFFLQRLFTPTRFSRRHAFVTLLAVLLVTSFVFSGVVVASGRALPGDTLYRTKITFERAQLALSGSSRSDGELYLSFADRRLEEIDRLVEKQQSADLDSALVSYDAALQAALASFSAQLEQHPERQAALSARLELFLQRADARLQALLESAPLDQQEKVRQALQASLAWRERARRLGLLSNPDRPGSLPPRSLPAARLTATPQPPAARPADPTASLTPQPSASLPARFLTAIAVSSRTPRPNNPGVLPTGWPTDWPTSLPTGRPDPQPTVVWPTAWPTNDRPTEWVVGAGTVTPRIPKVKTPEPGNPLPVRTPRPTSWKSMP